jgi:hypothetical protein
MEDTSLDYMVDTTLKDVDVNGRDQFEREK